MNPQVLRRFSFTARYIRMTLLMFARADACQPDGDCVTSHGTLVPCLSIIRGDQNAAVWQDFVPQQISLESFLPSSPPTIQSISIENVFYEASIFSSLIEPVASHCI